VSTAVAVMAAAATMGKVAAALKEAETAAS